jgi:hypothetical protein
MVVLYLTSPRKKASIDSFGHISVVENILDLVPLSQNSSFFAKVWVILLNHMH